MPTKAPANSGRTEAPATMQPSLSRTPAGSAHVGSRQTQPSGKSHLAKLAAAASESPRVQAQLNLAREAQNSAPVQRLRNTAQLIQDGKGVSINDDPKLENEAEAMGSKAAKVNGKAGSADTPALQQPTSNAQRASSAIQLFRPLAANKYKVKRKAQGGQRDPSTLFTTQSKDPALMEEESGYAIRHEIAETNTRQDINIADDGTIAIHNTDTVAKEFYAVDSVFQDSNKKLASANSAVKLVQSSGLRIVTGGEALRKITPEAAKEEEDAQATQFASLLSDICIELASSIIGSAQLKKHEAVFQPVGSEEQSVANIASVEGAGDPKIGRLANLLGQPGKNIKGKDIRKGFREQIHEDGNAPEAGVKRYGEKSGKGDLDDRERKLGVNRYARPEVGEAYATFSLSADAGKQIDYSAGDQAVDRMGKAWGYHFAAVVAKSRDGQDTITLENYNRKDDLGDRFKELLHHLIAANMERLEGKLEPFKPLAKDDRFEIQQKFFQALMLIKGEEFDEVDANREYVKILKTYQPTEAWFFRMQGSRKDQSFHEQQAQSGAHFNPLTLRVRPQNEKTNALRAQFVKKLTYPQLPSLLEAENEFKQLEKVTGSATKGIQDAETDELIPSACDAGLFMVAKSLLESTAAVVVRLTRQHEAEVPDKLLTAVTSAKDIPAMAKRAAELAEHCHGAIENKIQSLSIWETEKKFAMTRDEFAVFEAWKYVPLVASHFAGNHGK